MVGCITTIYNIFSDDDLLPDPMIKIVLSYCRFQYNEDKLSSSLVVNSTNICTHGNYVYYLFFEKGVVIINKHNYLNNRITIFQFFANITNTRHQLTVINNIVYCIFSDIIHAFDMKTDKHISFSHCSNLTLVNNIPITREKLVEKSIPYMILSSVNYDSYLMSIANNRIYFLRKSDDKTYWLGTHINIAYLEIKDRKCALNNLSPLQLAFNESFDLKYISYKNGRIERHSKFRYSNILGFFTTNKYICLNVAFYFHEMMNDHEQIMLFFDLTGKYLRHYRIRDTSKKISHVLNNTMLSTLVENEKTYIDVHLIK